MDKRIQQAYDFIKKNYQQKLLLQDLAALVDLSPFHFQRLFKQEMGESPLQCMNRIRIERAAHLMRAIPDLSMSEIAADCGFSSLATFSRAFSQKIGMSPLVFSQSVHPADIDMTPVSPEPLFDVKIEYFPDMHLYYTRTSIYREQLLEDFQAALSFCELEGIHHPSKRMIGVWTYLTIHHPHQAFNYYAGAQLAENVNVTNFEKIYFIPEGKYACFSTNHSYHQFLGILIEWKANWLDKKPYVIRDLFAFEIIDPAAKKMDYPCFQRRICIPIRHK
ncbi:MAG: AraC family transcriptional regulator [Saprospiraceae bacterium]|nr:AraC family transcriptional regulator [Saprospiraceae bacterium]